MVTILAGNVKVVNAVHFSKQFAGNVVNVPEKVTLVRDVHP